MAATRLSGTTYQSQRGSCWVRRPIQTDTAAPASEPTTVTAPGAEQGEEASAADRAAGDPPDRLADGDQLAADVRRDLVDQVADGGCATWPRGVSRTIRGSLPRSARTPR